MEGPIHSYENVIKKPSFKKQIRTHEKEHTKSGPVAQGYRTWLVCEGLNFSTAKISK